EGWWRSGGLGCVSIKRHVILSEVCGAKKRSKPFQIPRRSTRQSLTSSVSCCTQTWKERAIKVGQVLERVDGGGEWGVVFGVAGGGEWSSRRLDGGSGSRWNLGE